MSCELDLRRDQIAFPARLTAAVLRRGEPVVMIAFEDVSERRANEAELARSEAALREMNERKDEFLAMLSHELRNPLSPIRTSVAVLQLAEPGSRIATHSIEIIDRSAAHMNRLVDDLLDITRITHGKIELRREIVDLTALVRRVIDDQRDVFSANHIEIATTLPSHELLLDADAARLVQVMMNLISNALKFTPKHGRIAIELAREGNAGVISVVDNGIGIAPELIGELLRPFAQVPQALDRNHGGLGLGLAMVKSLVELHGGRVTIRSAGLGHGTEVKVVLPIQQASSAVRAVDLAPVSARRRVLIVEDMPDNARSMEQALKLRGHDVEVALNGFTALERLATFKPEVVLCDIGLPDMDGFAFAMRVRADEALRHVCLVALSGYARAEDVRRAKAAGFDRHLAKPARLDQIDRLLAELVPRTTRDPFDNNTLH
ncbi:MAG TPA: ATP-binding protein [Kofleriaceae bacterium]|nr:ATP-binding protein [Kofleriaceae bacterium]